MDDQQYGDSTIVGPSLVPKLEVVQGDFTGKIYTLKFKTRIGRETDNDIALADPKISRYHCQISFDDGKWLLLDLGSANQTYLNGMSINVPQPLSHEDQIAMGETVFVFRDPMDETDAPFDPSSAIVGGPTPPYELPASTSSTAPETKTSSSGLAWITGGLILILLLAVAGIILWFRGNKDSQQKPAAVPPTEAVALIRTTPLAEANLVLQFEDDFSASDSGWDDAFGKGYTKQYGNSKYHIEITTNNLVVWGLANRNAADFEVEVEATLEDGGEANTYGLIFRYVDQNNYYRFDVSGDGYFLLTKFHNEEWATLVDWTQSDALNQGQATNVLKISAFGPEIIIYANGQELARVSDGDFSQGNFGFFASTFTDSHIWVSFDNLKLWGPEQQEIAIIPTITPTSAPIIAKQQPEIAAATLEVAPQATNTAPVVVVETPSPSASGTEETPVVVESPTTQVEEIPTAVAPVPLPDFVSREQPLARGEQRLPGKIVFPLYDSARQTYDIYRANTDGSDQELLAMEASQPAMNKTGANIAYRSWKADERGLITRVVGETNHWLFSPFFEAASPAFDPGEQFFVFHSREGGETPAIYRTVGAEPEVLRREGAPIQGAMPALTSDGRMVYKGCLDGGTCGLIVSNLDGAFPMQLTINADDTAPSISPDNSTAAFMSNKDGVWEIYTIGLDGQNLQRITNDADGDDGLPVWSPDGQYLAFASNRDGHWAIWVATPTGEQKHQLFDLEASLDGIVQVDVAHSFGWTEEHIVWTP
ncbi:MAG TPA: FHA domain-containing protein [Chloroflexi bacterium]|nr:FHA domain-containing protein [Chloroflexota bacterium]